MSISTIRSSVLMISLGCLLLAPPLASAQNLVDFNFFNNTSNNQILTTANTAGLFSTASGWSVVGNQISLTNGVNPTT